MKDSTNAVCSTLRRWGVIGLSLATLLVGFAVGIVSYRYRLPLYTVPAAVYESLRGDESDVGEGGGTRWREAATEGSGVTLGGAPRADRDGAGVEEQIAALEALGYVSGSQEAPVQSGVTTARASVTSARYLVTDGHAPSALLMDAEGRVLHTWTKEFDEAFPGNQVNDNTDGIGYFRRAALLDGGELLAIYEGQGLIKLDADSNLVWAFPKLAHHDLEVNVDGSVYVLTRKARVIERLHPTSPILEDFVTLVSSDGEEIRSISIFEALEKSAFRSLVEASERRGDMLHTNTLEVLDGRLSHLHPAFRKGNVMLSLLRVNAIVILDVEAERVVWAMGTLFVEQHQPTVLDNGTIMVFDNRGDLGKSRVIEIDPVTREVKWEYSGRRHGFYSETCGSSQRLPSGNTLITESDRGRAFEVTPGGEKVWEYVTPHRAGPNREFIATLFEVLQLPEDTDLSWLADETSG